MKEYIERKVAISELECLPDQGELDYLGVFDCVRSVPAADVAPVVHGEWIAKVHNDGLGNYTLYHCSECDCKNAYKRNYCGDCGARMDGGNSND